LERHCGQSAALWAGFSASRGQTIVTLDGDGQNDPADIPALVRELAAADLVIGCRRPRQDPLSKRLFAGMANAARNWLTGSRIPDSGCGLRAMRREVLACLVPFDGMHRFVPTLAEMAGLRVRSIDVRHRARRSGRSKYGILDRVAGPLLDCLMLRRLARRKLPPANARELRRPAQTAAALAASAGGE
jgi:glycosyltransferase involved in cell wall biosynthesis